MIKAVVFDYFGVLCGGAFQALLALADSDTSREVRDLHAAKDHGFLDYDEFVARVADVIKHDVEEVHEIINQRQVENGPLIEYIAELRQNYKVGLLSNIDSETFAKIFDGRTDEMFDAAVASSIAGVSKPDVRAFELIASQLGVNTHDCIMVDDLIRNCDAAESAGMSSVVHVGNHSTIRRIEELLQNA